MTRHPLQCNVLRPMQLGPRGWLVGSYRATAGNMNTSVGWDSLLLWGPFLASLCCIGTALPPHDKRRSRPVNSLYLMELLRGRAAAGAAALAMHVSWHQPELETTMVWQLEEFTEKRLAWEAMNSQNRAASATAGSVVPRIGR